jgi:plastocyanin
MKALRWVLLAAVGCVIAVACFSDRGAGPGNVAGECQVPISVIDSTHFIVAIRNFAFRPDSQKVPPGATVTWVNCEDPGQEPHTTTSVTAVWSSPTMVSGQRYSHTFPAGGTFPYSCTIHPSMLGKIVVQ